MNDVKAPRNAPSRSPLRARASSQPDSSEQLGELEFSDWYETPVFEPDEDELMEEMATSGHGPRRLMARMVLARDARKALRRPQWDEAPPPPRTRTAPSTAPVARKEPTPRPAATQPAATTPAPKPAATTPAPKPAATTPAPKPAASAPAPKAAATTPAARPAAEARAPKPVPAPKPAATTPAPKPVPAPKPAATTPAPKPAAPTPPREPAMPKDRWSAWATSGPSMDEETMQLDLERDSWRRRIDSFLDRWAAAEVAVAARLDKSIEKVLSQSEPRSILSSLSSRRDDSD